MKTTLIYCLIVAIVLFQVANACDCNHYSGGCKISKPAPKGRACKCVYKGFWTCTGHIRSCSNPSNHYCQNPDKSIFSCEQGGGNCGGY